MDIIKMYEEVIRDCIEMYLENMEEEDKVKLEEKDIDNIIYKIIYKNEHVWEVMNDAINYYIGEILIGKETK